MSTPIEWTDETWNPTRGCSRVSPGCVNCYAERIAARFGDPDNEMYFDGKKQNAFIGYIKIVNDHPVWNGKVELIESKLDEPLHWRKGQLCHVLARGAMNREFEDGTRAIISRNALRKVTAINA